MSDFHPGSVRRFSPLCLRVRRLYGSGSISGTLRGALPQCEIYDRGSPLQLSLLLFFQIDGPRVFYALGRDDHWLRDYF